MKRILTTTALALTMGSTAFAASHTSGGDTSSDMNTGAPFVAQSGEMNVEMRASDLIGMRVYTSATPVEQTAVTNASDDWNNVGEVNDVLLARDGSIEAILLDIGGFLGIGEKQVAVRMDQVNFVTDGDTDGDFFVVFAADQAALENAPEYDVSTLYGWLEAETEENAAAMNEEMQGNDGENTDMAASSSMNAEGNDMQSDNMAANDMQSMNTEGYETADMTALTSEELTGTPAFGENGQRVGEVSQLLIDQEEITDVVIDFGGFLGIGEKPVRLSIGDVNIERSAENQNLRVTVNVTEQEVEQMDAYDG